MEKAAPVLAFRVIPTTILTLVTCFSIFVALIVTDVLPNAPKDQGGLNLTQAYDDLRQVCLMILDFLLAELDHNYCRSRLTLILITPIRMMSFALTSYPDSYHWENSTRTSISAMISLAMALGPPPSLQSISRELTF